MSVRVKIALTLAAISLLSLLAALSASAEPVLDVKLTRASEHPVPITHSDERLAYIASVRNTASKNPEVGQELTCTLSSSGAITEVQWLRSGELISGATTAKYTTTAADAGKSLQCMVTSTSADPDGVGTKYAPVGVVSVSRPPVLVEPVSSPKPPSGLSAPTVTGPVLSTPVGTATTAADSKLLTDVITAKGIGTRTAGSKIITGLATTSGLFLTEFPFMAISGSGIPAPTTGTGVIDGKGLQAGTKVITGVTTTSGAFAVGQEIRGETFGQGTFITAVGPETIEVSEVIGRFKKAFTADLYAYTRITAVGPETLELSAPATTSGTGALSAGLAPFRFGQKITGNGIPPGTTVTGLEGQRMELSSPATVTNSEVAITGTSELTCSPPTWTGTKLTWSLQWLRNAKPIPGETSSTYVVQKADTEPPSYIQCQATVEDSAGNKAISVSFRNSTRPEAPVGASADAGPITSESTTKGEAVLDLELPPGTQILRLVQLAGNTWTCIKTEPTSMQPATARCTSTASVQPETSYLPIELVAQVSSNAPDTLVTKASASGGGAPNAPSAEDTVSGILPAVPFGFEIFETKVFDDEGNDFTQAGGHPFSAGADLEFTTHIKPIPSETGFRAVNGYVREVRTETPPGFSGNPEALGAKCASVTDIIARPSNCPAASAVGGISIKTNAGEFLDLPIYALEPEHGTPALFGFGIGRLGEGFGYTILPELRPDDHYAITLVTAPVQKNPELFEAHATLCNRGAKIALIDGGSEFGFTGCRKSFELGATERPFLTLPTKCGDPASSTTRMLADTWEDPGNYAEAKYTLPTPKGCEGLAFEPSLKARPTTNAADSPSGLEVDLELPQNEDPEGTATAHLKKAVVTLPEGLLVNPSSANGLGACSEAQLGMANGVPNNDPVRCPDASKLGQATVTTPILDHTLPGTLYLATPHANPFDSLIALYLTIESPKDGLVVKLPGEVRTDPNTGRITSTFDQNPQTPVERVELKFRSGATAPLRTPVTCAKYSTTSSLTPWSAPESGPPATPKDTYQINRGPGGGACVATPPNSPSFEAGSASAIAGAHAPFVVKLRREDGSQQFSALTVTPPPGLLAKLAGTVRCSEAALAGAQAKSGRQEQAAPSCPAGSELGNVLAAAGAGPAPYRAPGKAYLAGPYKGAPLSIAVITPAVAGPFDLGTVVVRAAAYVNPTTAQVTVKSDPLPSILQGIPLDIRQANVSIDRPGFTLNPTSCDPMAVSGELLSTLGNTASLSNRFQMAECGRLAFKPKLKLRLKGKTNRGAYQGLRATLTAKAGEANIASASVTLPRSAFVAQEHIRTICTRVQFAADTCPKGSIYGKARAITPLLDEPLTGPVYLRSSDNELPDLVIALRGPAHLPVEVELAGRIDSVKGALRNTFELVPDAPVSKFTLEMFGGRKGLIVNSKNLCAKAQRASIEMTAQNGKVFSATPLTANDCKKARKGKKRRK